VPSALCPPPSALESPHSASIAVAQEPQLGAVVNDSARINASLDLAGKLLTVELRNGLEDEGGGWSCVPGRRSGGVQS
jgi:hypothetical protein